MQHLFLIAKAQILKEKINKSLLVQINLV